MDYADAAVIAREAGDEMLARLELMTVAPKVIVDVGCGTGELSAKLHSRYPQANMIHLDLSELMLAQVKTSKLVCADAEKLPLRDQSVDLVFANLLLPWCHDFAAVLREWRRVLRPEGLLIFSALGLDTLQEWRGLLQEDEIPLLADMHDIGDMLLQEGFTDPVLDVDHYTTTYRDKKRLLHELRASGMWTPADEQRADHVANEIKLSDDVFAVTYEIIHAHTFVPELNSGISPSDDGVVRVPLSHLRQQLLGAKNR